MSTPKENMPASSPLVLDGRKSASVLDERKTAYVLDGQKSASVLDERKTAYVLGVHNALNYDLDLQLPYTQPHLPKYTYVNKEDDIPYAFDHQVGYIHKCRLYNIKTKEGSSTSTLRSATKYISHLIDEWNGWIGYCAHARDRYDRILVSLFNPITKEDISDLLLRKYPSAFGQYTTLTAISPGQKRATTCHIGQKYPPASACSMLDQPS